MSAAYFAEGESKPPHHLNHMPISMDSANGMCVLKSFSKNILFVDTSCPKCFVDLLELSPFKFKFGFVDT